MSRHRIFIVEDDGVAATLLSGWLQQAGMEPHVFREAPPALAALEELRPACLLLDLELPGMHGLEALRRIRLRSSCLPVVIVTASQEPETAVEAMRTGATDYLIKPLQHHRLLATVERCLAEAAVEPTADCGAGEERFGIVGQSAAIQQLVERVGRVAVTGVSVYVSGESGAGKELVARAVHRASPRAEGPFVAVNCGAITESLQDSELFGHEKGAFTGAVARRRGVFEQAQGGTVFLDEVADLAPATQVRLLRVLQSRTLTRVGGEQPVAVDVRVVSATNKDLRVEVEHGRFRQDLFYRLVVYPIWVPPLRDHAEDIPALVKHFILCSGQIVQGKEVSVSPAAMACLQAYPFPGNVRELDNVIRRTLVNCGGQAIELEHLPASIRTYASKASTAAPAARPMDEPAAPSAPPKLRPPSRSFTAEEIAELTRDAPFRVNLSLEEGAGDLMEHAQRETIIAALIATEGRVVRAARKLGLSRSTLYRRLQEYGISPADYRQATERMSETEE